jgi:hypothetical protein
VKNIRRWHLYLSCFFAPMLLFYIGTGWYQTFNVNRNKLQGEGGNWIAKLRSVHVDQILPADAATGYSPHLFRWAVALMSICLIVTILLGMILAFRTTRKAWIVWLCLGLGVIAPIILLWLGQTRS